MKPESSPFESLLTEVRSPDPSFPRTHALWVLGIILMGSICAAMYMLVLRQHHYSPLLTEPMPAPSLAEFFQSFVLMGAYAFAAALLLSLPLAWIPYRKWPYSRRLLRLGLIVSVLAFFVLTVLLAQHPTLFF